MADVKAAALVLLVLVAIGCRAPVFDARDFPPPPVALVASAADEVSLEVPELICSGCRSDIMSGARSIPGVLAVRAAMEQKVLTLRFDPGATDPASVLVAVQIVIDHLIDVAPK